MKKIKLPRKLKKNVIRLFGREYYQKRKSNLNVDESFTFVRDVHAVPYGDGMRCFPGKVIRNTTR